MMARQINGFAREFRNACKKAESIVAEQVFSDTRPYVPADTLSLANRSRVNGNEIIYPGPYARYLYYGKVMVDENGNGPMHYIDENGNEVIRFRKGATLHPTERDLQFDKTTHKLAQAHWVEASTAQNKSSWKRVATEAVKRELK